VSWVVITIAVLCACSAMTNVFVAWHHRSDRRDAILRLVGGAIGLLPIAGVIIFKINHLTLNPSVRIRYILSGVALLVGMTLLLPESIQRARQRRKQREPAQVAVHMGGSDSWVN
jgi:TRAP-type C4-dicarboxylate transport system permease small subunit